MQDILILELAQARISPTCARCNRENLALSKSMQTGGQITVAVCCKPCMWVSIRAWQDLAALDYLKNQTLGGVAVGRAHQLWSKGLFQTLLSDLFYIEIYNL